MTRKLLAAVAASAFVANGAALAGVDVVPFDPAVDPLDNLINALVGAGSGISVVPGTASFIGASGQSGTYSNFSLVPGDATRPTLTLGDGVALSSGAADLPDSNTQPNFNVTTGTGSNADLEAVLAAAGQNVGTNDQNVLTFDFTLDSPDDNAVTTNFIFGSEEFPDQSITDGFAFFVDGVNFARFQNGDLVTFSDTGNFNNNVDDIYGYELDGISDSLTLTGLLDMSLAVHTITIVIADTSDSIFQSNVFIEGLRSTFSDGDGGVVVTPEVPLPAAALLFPAGIAGLAAARRRRAKA